LLTVSNEELLAYMYAYTLQTNLYGKAVKYILLLRILVYLVENWSTAGEKLKLSTRFRPIFDQ